MTADYFQPRLKKEQIGALSSLALAHIGDSVFELMARCAAISGGGAPARTLHRRTVALVRADAQAAAARRLAPELTEEEADVFRRGRNAHPKTLPRHATHEAYAQATGLEALFGWLYLHGRTERLNELFSMLLAGEGRGTEAEDA